MMREPEADRPPSYDTATGPGVRGARRARRLANWGAICAALPPVLCCGSYLWVGYGQILALRLLGASALPVLAAFRPLDLLPLFVVIGLLSVVLSSLALRDYRKHSIDSHGRSFAKTGLIAGSVVFAISLVVFLLVFGFLAYCGATNCLPQGMRA